MTVEEFIKQKNPSKVTLKLIEKLSAFSKASDYILGTSAESPFDKDRQLIIDYIENGEAVSYENVLLFSLETGLQRDKQLNRRNIPSPLGEDGFLMPEYARTRGGFSRSTFLIHLGADFFYFLSEN